VSSISAFFRFLPLPFPLPFPILFELGNAGSSIMRIGGESARERKGAEGREGDGKESGPGDGERKPTGESAGEKEVMSTEGERSRRGEEVVLGVGESSGGGGRTKWKVRAAI
jgi:hypothetical protein